MNTTSIIEALWTASDEEKREFLPYFFKTGKGQYGEGDKFMGVVVPKVRKIALEYKDITFEEIRELLQDEYHEVRLCALLILVQRFKKAKEEKERTSIYNYYLDNTKYINNWDLVDLSCKYIVGEYLVGKSYQDLINLAKSGMLWEERIAIVSTAAFIRRSEFKACIEISEILLYHKHDLIHKAVGWMLRELGKKDKTVLCDFLNKYHTSMPRTMLRYSIEKFSPEEKAHYMKRKQ